MFGRHFHPDAIRDNKPSIAKASKRKLFSPKGRRSPNAAKKDYKVYAGVKRTDNFISSNVIDPNVPLVDFKGLDSTFSNQEDDFLSRDSVNLKILNSPSPSR